MRDFCDLPDEAKIALWTALERLFDLTVHGAELLQGWVCEVLPL